MKRYLVFGYNAYYPGGGWSDFIDSFDTIEEALEIVNKTEPDWYGRDKALHEYYDVVDSTTGEYDHYMKD